MPQRSSPKVDSREAERVSIESLLHELEDFGQITTDGTKRSVEGGRPQERDQARHVLSGVRNTLFPDQDFRFDESLIKQNLDEILLLLVLLGDRGTHGKGLMDDLARLFGAHISPGTVYPRLHDLENDGLLGMQEKVRTKEYHIDEDQKVRTRLEWNMYQHLALGYAIHLSLAAN